MKSLYLALLDRKESSTFYPYTDTAIEHLEVDQIESDYLDEEYRHLEELHGEEFREAYSEANLVMLVNMTVKIMAIHRKVALVECPGGTYRVWVLNRFLPKVFTSKVTAFKLACHRARYYFLA